MSTFTEALASIAEGEFDKYHLQHEHDPGLSAEIRQYWTAVGQPFPGVSTPWSAVFISWCVKEAGATAHDFKFAAAHSVFVQWAIKNADHETGSFRAFPITNYSPNLGDIIQNNRNGNSFNYDYARMHSSYESHSAIVIETGRDSGGRYALTVGGNESDSVGKKLIRLDNDGLVIQRPHSSYICVIADTM